MKINSKKILFMTFLLTNTYLFAEVDLQKNIYNAAEEMIRMDEKMNQAIAKHNQIDSQNDAQMRLEAMSINDFEETQFTYKLIRNIPDAKNTEVTAKVVDGVLIINTKSIDKDFFSSELNTTTTTTMSSMQVSLLMPNNADATKMHQTYVEGVLIIEFPKK
ncbi:MAG: Unknown protein [uncultured Sulfurovum sp.]|uniref:SHSP domain-containing protein n=1 Tax=uncultured Sulfurovum sp. TaxID=269237 RepID=A0A6S6TUR0_9BACT|nr:MAG: Unknown protein [uncultured Sulfurovum sp.]